MQITLTLPDDLARQIQILPNPEQFIREALQAVIQQRIEQTVTQGFGMLKSRRRAVPVDFDPANMLRK
ncbi:hypothetical protein [Thioflexithrix psekupsensis]|uniref:Uncharacterized protein n=1 Tax=Thioflexithrix psekupsensis TaxID=1570016 RepID=A0A251X8V9_9GAMM|nr:hypothetical protein [Thioflexithrix psekupsensis]OUD14370.1 hypothetical protein TPSD3_08625 [Thioflexithrix psekupsensis]